MIGIDEGQSDQCSTEQKIHCPLETDIELQVDQCADGGSECFDERIADRNLLLAVATAAAKDDVAQYRNVIEAANGFLALRTTRAGETTDCSRGILEIQTLRKLPIANPISTVKSNTIVSEVYGTPSGKHNGPQRPLSATRAIHP